MMETITSCAIKTGDRIVALPKPARHPHILHAFPGTAGGIQGFMTSTGRFVTRGLAHQIARKAGQIVRRCGGDDHTLFSENLW